MKNYITTILIITCFLGYSQKMKIKQGNFDFIKGQKEINVEFVYDNMKLLKKKLSEEEYIKKHEAELEEKVKGKGKIWTKKWTSAKELIFEPKFLELMNRYFYKDHNINFEQNLTDTKYTLIVETIWVYPGWDAGVMKQPAKVTTLLKFVETANRDNTIAEITSQNSPGDQWGNSFSNEDRIGEGYAKTGKSFAKLILKKSF